MGQLRQRNSQHQERVAEQGDAEKGAELRAAVQGMDVAEEHHQHQREVAGFLNALALVERPLEIEECDQTHPRSHHQNMLHDVFIEHGFVR